MCNEPERSLWPPDLEAELEMCFVSQQTTSTPSVLNSWVSGWLRALPIPKEL